MYDPFDVTLKYVWPQCRCSGCSGCSGCCWCSGFSGAVGAVGAVGGAFPVWPGSDHSWIELRIIAKAMPPPPSGSFLPYLARRDCLPSFRLLCPRTVERKRFYTFHYFFIFMFIFSFFSTAPRHVLQAHRKPRSKARRTWTLHCPISKHASKRASSVLAAS